MEDNDSEQNIDRPVSASPIDQITKLPAPKPKAKVKNPKRVAAGKKLSQYNMKAKEQQKIFKKLLMKKKIKNDEMEKKMMVMIDGYLKHHFHQSSR